MAIGKGKDSKLELTNGKTLKRRKPDHRAFDAAKRAAFFETLRASCNIAQSARAAGIHVATVYRHRAASAAFRARWIEAVREAYADLELAMLERALNGTIRTERAGDGSITRQVHDYPNAVALTLLRLHRDMAIEAGAERGPAEVEELRERLARKIERMRERLKRQRNPESDPQ